MTMAENGQHWPRMTKNEKFSADWNNGQERVRVNQNQIITVQPLLCHSVGYLKIETIHGREFSLNGFS